MWLKSEDFNDEIFWGVLGTSLVWEVKRTKQIVPISPAGGRGWGVVALGHFCYECHPTGFLGLQPAFSSDMSVVSSCQL